MPRLGDQRNQTKAEIEKQKTENRTLISSKRGQIVSSRSLGRQKAAAQKSDHWNNL